MCSRLCSLSYSEQIAVLGAFFEFCAPGDARESLTVYILEEVAAVLDFDLLNISSRKTELL